MKRNMAALVLGNGAYPDGDALMNPVNDAVDLGAKLKSYGFNVIGATDCSAKEMDKQLKAFRGLLDSHEVGLFFFAGHGIQIEGRNYLLALDTDMESETDAMYSSLSLDKVVDVMGRSAAATRIIVLDACRNNPWERKWHRGAGSRGLASVYAPKGTIIGFATSPGEVAYDGVGRNGTYTAALLQHIDTPDRTIESMFQRVRNTVAAASGGKQTSWEHTSLLGEFYFNLSIGNLINEYAGTALADSRFVLDETKMSHKIIAGLKTYTWPKQNPAIDRLNAESVGLMAKNSLFVVGRNIYQSACGSSNAAQSYIRDFVAVTMGYDKAKRKSILDGILFEIFFDSRGELRSKIKKGFFSEVFELQRFADLKASFDFIAEALTAARADFHAVPGKGHELAVAVSAKKHKGSLVVDAIYVGGADVLRPKEDAWDSDDGERFYARIGAERVNEMLSEQLVVPARLLKVTYTPGEAGLSDELGFPTGWTVCQA